MSDLAIASQLRGCDFVTLKIGDLVAGGGIRSCAIVVQQRSGRSVQFGFATLWSDPPRDSRRGPHIPFYSRGRAGCNRPWLAGPGRCDRLGRPLAEPRPMANVGLINPSFNPFNSGKNYASLFWRRGDPAGHQAAVAGRARNQTSSHSLRGSH